MEPPDLTAAWKVAQARLPEGWRIEALRCASTSIRPEDRSDDWIAVATGPGGEERTAQAGDPILALAELVASLADV